MFHDKDKIWKDFWYFFLYSNIKISSPQAIANSSFCLRLTSCSLDCIHWPKSAKLSRGQMAQIIVRKIRPRKSKWAKLAFSAASLSIAHASSGPRGMKRGCECHSREHKEPGSLMISWDTTSASSDTWSVSEKQGEKECSQQRELVEKGHISEKQKEDGCVWIINLWKSFLR